MIRIEHETDRAVSLFHQERLLCRYVYVSQQPEIEAPRPYFHPLNSLGGDTLTNFRPNDHPWHHGLSLTLNDVSGVNFWGGPTYFREGGYKMPARHGSQHHIGWQRLEARENESVLAHSIEWRDAGDVLFREERSLVINVDEKAGAWSLHWSSSLNNVSGRTLSLGNPHSNGGLNGSHYTGLQFRGARELLDDHLDPLIAVKAEGDRTGVDAVHGSAAKWMEWHGQSDTSLRRVVIRFENTAGPLHWFVRRNNPLVAFPVQYDRNLDLAAGANLVLDHTLTFTGA